MRTLLASLSLVGLLAVAAPAAAQETDLPDDIFGDDVTPPEPSIAQEREQLLSENAEESGVPEAPRKKRVIQTIQEKSFIKLNRYEGAIGAGFVTNDPFVNRYLIHGNLAYHVTEVFAVEASAAYSPDFGEADYKGITNQIINENEVTPDISKIQAMGSANMQFSPIYGKVAVGPNTIINFDIFGVFGAGVVNTRDDLQALQAENEDIALATESQFHPTLNFGGGARVIFSEGFAVRVEGRGLSYIEVLESTTLEMKNNFTLLASASFFFPGMK